MAYEVPDILLNEFASAVIEDKNKVERTVYATVVSTDSENVEVVIDGSPTVTPAVPMVGTAVGDRVTVMFKNRKCVITGNATSPAITTSGSFRYSDLPDKPSIEEVTLVGDKSFEDLGLDRITNTELENMLTF